MVAAVVVVIKYSPCFSCFHSPGGRGDREDWEGREKGKPGRERNGKERRIGWKTGTERERERI